MAVGGFVVVPEESKPAYYRPAERRLVSLTNEELRLLFDLRAAKVREKLDPKGFWDNPRIVYWGQMFEPMMALYEVLLEIQARYPKDEICPQGKPGWFEKLIPLKEWPWAEVAARMLNPKRKESD